jgi:hypothetical protein
MGKLAECVAERTVESDRRIEAILARHCAPVLFERKPAALLGSRAVPEKYHDADLSRYGMRVLRLTSTNRPLLLLFYRPDLLAQTLAQPCVCRALHTLGYPDVRAGQWERLLRVLQQRFLESSEFPHEVGLFLGYPVTDVLGFISCKGKGCKLCGLWKVYGDVEGARRRFAEFAQLRNTLCTFVQNGGSIKSIMGNNASISIKSTMGATTSGTVGGNTHSMELSNAVGGRPPVPAANTVNLSKMVG